MNDRQVVQRMHVHDFARNLDRTRERQRTSPTDTGTVLRSVMIRPRSASMISPAPW